MADKKKILIADDEVPLAKALSIKLSHEGYDVQTAVNGEEVLDALAKGSFDLLLLDLVMPKKDGFSVLEELQKQNKTLPIIVTSNLGQEEDIKRVHQYGIKDYLIKADTSIADIVKFVKDKIEPAGSATPAAPVEVTVPAAPIEPAAAPTPETSAAPATPVTPAAPAEPAPAEPTAPAPEAAPAS